MAMTPGQAARQLLRRRRYGVLSTASQKFPGYPYGSFVDYVTDQLGRPVILISALAEHTHNIVHQSHVSLAVHDPGEQAQAMPRLALLGEARLIGPDDAHNIRNRYLRYFPEAEPYLALDFAFYRIEPQHMRYIPGFAQATWISAVDFLALGSRLADSEESLLQQTQNGQQVSLVGVDCDGCDVRADGQIQRFDFTETAVDATAVRAQMQALAHGK
jgi:hypothetical protein